MAQGAASSPLWQQQLLHFHFSEILYATDNFEESLVIGHGGFGKVYKGTLRNGSVTAIKRLDSISQGATEFWAEVEALSTLYHYHLVSLIGYCKDGIEMVLVYEYISNGSLADHLHKDCTPLSWLQRLLICLGAAKGLEYLHTSQGVRSGIIHRDVKSSNVLLLDNWDAKISDFGLSKRATRNKETSSVSCANVAGTFGYIDPSYQQTGKVTPKSDVYAFGVVLLELLCRKRAVDASLGKERRGLAEWAQQSIKEGRLKSIVDAQLMDQISEKCLIKFGNLAVRCLHSDPKQRPTMTQVVSALDKLLTLQREANNSSSQHTGSITFHRMLRLCICHSNSDHSAHGDPSLTDRKGNNTSAPSTKEEAVDCRKPSTSLQVFRYADLKRATNEFSPDRLLYDEGQGAVFLGWVDDNTLGPSNPAVGTAVSVRRLHPGYDWLEEVILMERLHHDNIVKLKGYCIDQEEKMLVYENMQRLRFCDFLFPSSNSADAAVSVEPLPWGTRLKVMLGVACGLNYLHSSEVQVLHRELKSSTVFLDQDFDAKLGDFGSERSDLLMGYTHVCTLFAGTFGHIDPLYFRTYCLTTKSDIYSFGVMLLETLTGKQSIDQTRPRKHYNLAMWLSRVSQNRDLRKGRVKELMDTRLKDNYPIEDAIKCFQLAVKCVADDPEIRPSSEQVLHTLEEICAPKDGPSSEISASEDRSSSA